MSARKPIRVPLTPHAADHAASRQFVVDTLAGGGAAYENVVTSTHYETDVDDYLVEVTAESAVQVTLGVRRVYPPVVIKIVAGQANVTVADKLGAQVEGGAALVFSGVGDSRSLSFTSASSNWRVH